MIEKLNCLFERLNRDGVTFDINMVGHKNYTIGTRATHISSPNIFDFLHEVSHLIQFTQKELDMKYNIFNGNLFFDTAQDELGGVFYSNPQTDQISMRELETFYIQYLIEVNEFDTPDVTFINWADENGVPELFKWLPDDYIFGYNPTSEYLLERCQTFIDKWDFEKILNKWFSLDLIPKDYDELEK